MSHLDPFIVYTLKLAMNHKSNKDSSHPVQQDPLQQNTLFYPSTLARILSVKPLPKNPNDQIPKLDKENLLSLLYHADDKWEKSANELSKVVTDECDEKQVNNVIHHVHQQQRVYLDTLHLLHKSILPDHSHKRFNEPIWFAAQVLYHQCHIRHLESFTELITPFAIQLVEALECVRQVTHSQCVQRTPSFSFVLLFASPSYMKTPCRTTLEPILFKFYQCWVQFEKILYQCYICAVFGSDATVSLKQALPENIKSPLPDVLFHDSFTQLLPMALDRAIQQNVITMGAIQTLDPNMFVAIPRLTLLAGMTWLSHLTGWRRTETVLPMWIQTHEATVHRIAFNLDILEKSILEAGSQEAHLDFVSTFTCLEHTLVSGISEQNMSELEKTIYLDVCSVADAILTSSHAQSFNAILYHLFRYYGLDYQHDDRMDLEDTLASLLI